MNRIVVDDLAGKENDLEVVKRHFEELLRRRNIQMTSTVQEELPERLSMVDNAYLTDIQENKEK